MKDFWDLSVVGIYDHMNLATPEAMKAQRQAELEQMAKYRSKRLQEYKDWSEPVKREAKKEAFRKEEEKCRPLMANIPAEQVAVQTGKRLEVTKMIFKPLPKLSFWQKMKRWLGFK